MSSIQSFNRILLKNDWVLCSFDMKFDVFKSNERIIIVIVCYMSSSFKFWCNFKICDCKINFRIIHVVSILNIAQSKLIFHECKVIFTSNIVVLIIDFKEIVLKFDLKLLDVFNIKTFDQSNNENLIIQFFFTI